MLEYLKVIAGSFPIAIMFIALCVAVVVLYLINWFKRADADDKALRASQARSVIRRDEE
jgi:uncharacterized membrane protein